MLVGIKKTVSGGHLEKFRQDAGEFLRLSNDLGELLEVGTLALSQGCLDLAQRVFSRCKGIEGGYDLAAANQIGVYLASGDFDKVIELYGQLLDKMPDQAALRRSLLTALEYAPHINDKTRHSAAVGWGQWAVDQAGGSKVRPILMPLNGRPIRVGYVSADICQHTVGLLVKGVIKAHRVDRVTSFVYNAGKHADWVTHEVARVSQYRDVSQLPDSELSELIKRDQIDVLVDLSGHTAGSRLSVFAYRPAPVMLSWLGYFATTGLPYMDAVLLDVWHTTEATSNHFVEPIVNLPLGRWCYQPVPWAPSTVSPPPCLKNGYVTFGSFNNTAKINESVIQLWAELLNKLPSSRLVLKWRTFNDEPYCQKIWDAFASLGVARYRIELRGPSFHKDLLLEYADIDIALDPFPFTGGLTTCESLWMGVPVVTMPQSRVVSRQSHAILSTIGLPELSAATPEQYVEVALSLAQNPTRLLSLRNGLREMMQRSSLMDVNGFTYALEECLFDLYHRIESAALPMKKKVVLHVGPGHKNNGAKLPLALQGPEWGEIRLDVDPNNEPDIVGSMLDMAEVADESVEVVYSAHNIEHVYDHQVQQVLREFYRVLKPGGFTLITCPDLQRLGLWLAEDRLTEDAYKSPAGGIRPLDMIYGHSDSIASGHHYMAHRTGFTLSSLSGALKEAGFARTAGKSKSASFDLWVLAVKGDVAVDALREMAERLLP